MSAAPAPEMDATQQAGVLLPALAGLLAALVGYASTFAIVLAGLQAAGATPHQAGSGLLAICLALGILNVAIAWRTRLPISIAWSTPGAAFLLASAARAGGFAETTGAFVMTGVLIVLAGLIRPLARAVAAIPQPIATAMLAGILLPLCIAPLSAVEQMPLLVLPVIAAWVLALRFARRYAVPAAVVVAAAVLALTSHVPAETFDGTWPTAILVMPQFTLESFIRTSLPLFVVTMASQNLPGLAVMKANGYDVAPTPLFIATGLASAAVAPLGGVTINLAAITAAICAGPESHPDPARRWVAPISAGATYIVLGLTAALAAAFVAASPPVLIQAVAGLALLSSLAGALSGAMGVEDVRLPAIVTFVTTASGVTLAGIGAPFWGIVAGIALQLLLRRWRSPAD